MIFVNFTDFHRVILVSQDLEMRIQWNLLRLVYCTHWETKKKPNKCVRVRKLAKCAFHNVYIICFPGWTEKIRFFQDFRPNCKAKYKWKTRNFAEIMTKIFLSRECKLFRTSKFSVLEYSWQLHFGKLSVNKCISLGTYGQFSVSIQNLHVKLQNSSWIHPNSSKK